MHIADRFHAGEHMISAKGYEPTVHAFGCVSIDDLQAVCHRVQAICLPTLVVILACLLGNSDACDSRIQGPTECYASLCCYQCTLLAERAPFSVPPPVENCDLSKFPSCCEHVNMFCLFVTLECELECCALRSDTLVSSFVFTR